MLDLGSGNIQDDDEVEITDLCDCAAFPGTARFACHTQTDFEYFGAG
jgi:hypothetical protein